MLQCLVNLGREVRGPSWRPRIFCFYLHVDDGLTIGCGTHVDVAPTSLQTCEKKLKAIGIPSLDIGLRDGVDNIPGHRKLARLQLLGQRAARRQVALEWLCSPCRVPCKTSRPVTGVWLWCALLDRCLLAIPHPLSTFVGKKRNGVVPWWQSAWHEVKAMAVHICGVTLVLRRPKGCWLEMPNASSCWVTAGLGWWPPGRCVAWSRRSASGARQLGTRWPLRMTGSAAP